MFKYILAILTGFWLCIYLDFETGPETRILMQLIDKSDQVMRNQGFQIRLTGRLWYPNIRLIGMTYSTTSYRFQTIEEARKFFVPLFETFIRPFNEEKRIRPFFCNFPLDATNLELAITFEEPQRKSLKAPWICHMATRQGYLIYMTEAPDREFATVFFKEPYEEAKKIVLQSP